MNFVYGFVFITLFFACCDTSKPAVAVKNSQDCQSYIEFVDSNIVALGFVMDSNKTAKSITDIFLCFKSRLSVDEKLKARFVTHSKFIEISFSYAFPEGDSCESSTNFLNMEFLSMVDTSQAWMNGVGYDKDLNKIILSSGYQKKWENVINEIIGKNCQWEYYVDELRLTPPPICYKSRCRKSLYPKSFVIVMSKKE